MDLRQIKIFFKLYWLSILIISLLVFFLSCTVWIFIVGIQAFVSMEVLYRKGMMSQMAFGLFQGVIQALIFASIYMGFHYFFFFGGGLSKLGKRRVKPEEVNVKWADVIGMKAIKKEVWEVVQLIRDHASLKHAGGKIIKGVLMVGPPGCGKTYMAKAIATETKLPFLHVVSSEFVGIIVGMGAQKIKSLFKEARGLAELHGGCLIFIDEIDSIARPRVTPTGLGGGISYNATVNQLLAELDGLQGEQNIVVIAATNVSDADLDPALMRPGRFDRKIHVGLPSLSDREAILRYYLGKVQYDKEHVDINKLARLTVTSSAADISNIVREASLISVRKRKTRLGMEDLSEAQERISLGIKSEIVLSARDKQIAAYHEAGHAMVAYLMVPTQDVFKASIIPRKGIGGVTWIMEAEERLITNKEELLGKIKILLSGFAAEKIKFGQTSIGVGDDLKKAGQLAMRMATEWGMGTSGASGASSGIYSQLAERDKEDILNRCLNEVNEMFHKEKDILEEIATQLLEKSEIDYDHLDAIFDKYGKRVMPGSYLEYGQGAQREKQGLNWDDIVGMQGAKEEAQEIVSLIKDRIKLQQVGGQIIRGLLMFGPPGCGKTYLASVMANQAGIPFITKSGSEFVEMYVGVGASRVRHLFQEARELALAKGGCIIFIDEFDALGSRRTKRASSAGREYNQTLNQLLVELDGLKEKETQYNIVIIGATNMQESNLDAAVLRPGRFDRKIHISLPRFSERKELFSYYLSKVKYNEQEVSPEKFAGITSGWSPAEISNLVREAALLAVRNKKDALGVKEIDEARERIELGLRENLTQSVEELKMTAYHETGHCLAAYFFGQGQFPFKLSVVPRKGTLGVAWYGRKGDSTGFTKEQYFSVIKKALGGYVAERFKYGTSTTGVSEDFKVAMRAAHAMVWQYGMGASGMIGDFLFSEDSQALLSEETKTRLNKEVQEILQDCKRSMEELLQQESELFEVLTNELIAKQELTYSELEVIFKAHAKNPPPPAKEE